ncbi:MAG: hypothetical protein JWN28_125 [Candidatus Saccharibacteria bacterium]|nr:hypothetical protein [Candidatus Saccharibacteria bacterium]
MLVAATAALIAAFVLSLEKIHLLQTPDAVLSCSFNVVLNCSTVMQSPQSTAFFGIPNMFIGLMAFPVIVTVAVAGLWGTRFPKKFLVTANIGVLLGTIFAYWLFFQSLYVIQVLCPWCLIVTTACTFMLAAFTHLNLKENNFNLKKKLNEKVQKFLQAGYHQLILASWLVLMVALVFIKFGDALFA